MQNWYCLSPHTYLKIINNDTLLINTHTQEYLIYKEKPSIVKLLRQKQALISSEDLHDPVIKNFIDISCEKDIGEIIPSLVPINIQTKTVDSEKLSKSYLRQEDPKIHISQLSHCFIYLNASCSQSCKNCSQYFKQFNFCKKQKTTQSISIERLKQFIRNGFTPDSLQLHFLGGNLFHFPKLKQLATFFPLNEINLYFYYQNILGNERYLIELSKEENVQVHIQVNSPFDLKQLSLITTKLISLRSTPSFSFSIEKEKELEQITEFIEENNISKYHIQPFFNGENLALFEDFVFVEEADILEEKQSPRTLYLKSQINFKHYHKLYIDFDGEVYSNLHSESIGNIYRNELEEVIKTEVYQMKNWFLTRNMLSPCNECIFHDVCPAPSNYEQALGKNNLCHVK